MPEARTLVHARGIDKAVAGRTVLSRVEVAVGANEIVTLIGPNGAGKTMLLRVLLGLVVPDRGEVWRQPALRIGYMPQRLAVEGTLPLTVRRFLALGAARPRQAIDAALGEVGAEGVADNPVQAISGGEFQRVLLARALLRDPELLVLDEPAQGVDLAGQEELFRLILAIRERRGCGVLMVSHDLRLVMAATDTVVCLNRHVCCTGHPELVSRHPEYLALFGPQLGAAFALYTHRHDHAHDPTGRVVPLDHGHG
ncbi:MAG: ATP-binding cassette domain-containing protein [Pseudomonadota bacterium]